jgi:hypothetical protein
LFVRLFFFFADVQAVDTQVLSEFIGLLNDAWCIPLQITGALIGISLLLGTAVLGALLTLAIMMYAERR